MPQLINSALWRRLLMGGARVVPWPADLALTALRVFTGLALALAHGWGKIPPSEQWVHQSLGAGDNAMGLPFPWVFAWCAALAEFVGGLLLAAGLLGRPAAVLVTINMAVAAFGFHWLTRQDPFGGMEMALLFFFIALTFVFVGSGRFSVDRFLR